MVLVSSMSVVVVEVSKSNPSLTNFKRFSAGPLPKTHESDSLFITYVNYSSHTKHTYIPTSFFCHAKKNTPIKISILHKTSMIITKIDDSLAFDFKDNIIHFIRIYVDE